MTHQECNVNLEDLLNNKTNYRLILHADEQSNINTDSANTLTTASYNTSTVITLNNFYDQRVLIPEIIKDELYA